MNQTLQCKIHSKFWNLAHNSLLNTLDVILLMHSRGKGSSGTWYQFLPILHGIPKKIQNSNKNGRMVLIIKFHTFQCSLWDCFRFVS